MIPTDGLCIKYAGLFTKPDTRYPDIEFLYPVGMNTTRIAYLKPETYFRGPRGCSPGIV